jgi:hypothetical protein
MGTTWRVSKETGIALSFVTEDIKSSSLEFVLMEAVGSRMSDVMSMDCTNP